MPVPLVANFTVDPEDTVRYDSDRQHTRARGTRRPNAKDPYFVLVAVDVERDTQEAVSTTALIPNVLMYSFVGLLRRR
jgi:hypothetical protein